MSELCPTCGQEMPDEPVRMTEANEPERTFMPPRQYVPLPAAGYDPTFLAAVANGDIDMGGS